MVRDDARFRPSPSVHTRVVGDEVVLLDFARGEYFALDAAGAQVWRLLERQASVHEMASDLVTRYDVEYSEVVHDIRALLADLQQRSLVIPA